MEYTSLIYTCIVYGVLLVLLFVFASTQYGRSVEVFFTNARMLTDFFVLFLIMQFVIIAMINFGKVIGRPMTIFGNFLKRMFKTIFNILFGIFTI